MYTSGVPETLKKIFPKDIIAKMKILKIIYENPEGRYINDLLKFTSLHRKTIYKYIHEINKISLEHLGKESISLSIKKKYRFNSSKSDYFTLRALLLETSIVVQLIDSLLSKSIVVTSKFCLTHYISENMLRREIKPLQLLLRKLDIILEIKKGTITIVGEEPKIRYYFTTFFWSFYRGVKWPFPTVDKNELSMILTTIYPKFSLKEMKIKNEVLLYILAINILRATSKHLVKNSEIPTYLHYINHDNYHALSYMKRLVNKKLNIIEIEYNLIVLRIFSEYFMPSENNRAIVETLRLHKASSYKAILHILELVNKSRTVPYDSCFDTTHHFLSALVINRMFIDLFKDVNLDIYALDSTYPTNRIDLDLFYRLECILKENDSLIPPTILRALIYQYHNICIKVFQKRFEPEIKIFIATDLPIYIENSLVNKIHTLLSQNHNIKICTNLTEDPPDLIIATGVIGCIFANIRTVYVGSNLTPLDSKVLLEEVITISNYKKRRNTE